MTRCSNAPHAYFEAHGDTINQEQFEFALLFWHYNPRVSDLDFDEMLKVLTEHWQAYTSSDMFALHDSSTYECCQDYIALHCNNIL